LLEERLTVMKRILVIAVLILWFAVPAHAQSFSGSVVGGVGIGKVNFPIVPNYPPAHFEVRAVSGGADFVPSSFASYEQALAEGRAALAVRAKTLGEIARENSSTPRARARLVLVQDDHGNAVLARI
jgi:hypothetical protein